MKYTYLPNTDIKVSKICLGTMTYGNQNTIDESEEQMDYALENGVNFFDTSDTYGDGRSEKFLSEILKTSNDIYVTTKLGRRIRGTSYAKGYKHEPMEEFIDRSLLNLKIEKIGKKILDETKDEINSLLNNEIKKT